MAVIKVLDNQYDRVVDTLDYDRGDFSSAVLRREINLLSTFDFDAHAGFASLTGRNRILVEAKRGGWMEFMIRGTKNTDHDTMEVLTDGAYVELRSANPIMPTKLPGATPESATTYILRGTGYQVGDIEYTGTALSLEFENPLDPYDALLRIATAFDMELRFRVEISGSRVVGRYVDLLKRLEGYRGRKFTNGRDLVGVKRTVDTSQLATALLVVGPDGAEEGKERLYTTVTDEDAFLRWGRQGQHVWAIHEPQTDQQELTIERLKTIGRTELNKRNTAAISYEIEALAFDSYEDIYDEFYDVDLGVTVRIQDTDFTPALYAEARVIKLSEDYGSGDIIDMELGEVVEYDEDDLLAQIAAIRSALAKKASDAKIADALAEIEASFEESLGLREPKIPMQPTAPANPKEEDKYLNNTTLPPILYVFKGGKWVKSTPTEASEVGAETPAGAQDKANAAKQEAIAEAERDAAAKAEQAEADAKAHADAAAKAAEDSAKSYAQQQAGEAQNAAIIAAAEDAKAKAEKALADAKADAQAKASAAQAAAIADAEGKLAAAKSALETAKADKATTYTKTDVDNALKGKASTTTVDTLTGRVSTAETVIEQHGTAIASKASQTVVDTLSGRVSTAESTLTQQAKEIASKVSQTDYDSLAGRVGTAESKITQQAGLIESKVDATYVDTAVRVKQPDGSSTAKTFSNVLSYQRSVASITGYLVIRTPIQPNRMTNIHISGYNYTGSSNVIDLDIGFYHYSTSVLQHGFSSNGTFKIEKVQIGRDASNRAVLVIGLPTTTWAYPTIIVDKAVIGYTTTPDSYKDGWTATIVDAMPADLTTIVNIGAFDLRSNMETLSTAIVQNQDAIRLRATKTELDTVAGRVSTAEGKITTMAGQIEAKAEKTVTDGLTTRMNTAETKISANEAAISQRATTTTVNALTTRVQTAEQTIDAHDAAIKTKAEISVTNGLNTRLQTAEQTISAQDKTIQSKVSQTDFNALAGRVSTAETKITQTEREIDLRVTKTSFDAFVEQQMNLVPNPARTEKVDGWTTSSGATRAIEEVDFLGKPTKALAIRSTASTQVYSPYFDVDPSKAYEVTIWLKSETPAPATTNAYIGLHGQPAGGATGTAIFEGVRSTTGVDIADSANFYFWSASGTSNLAEWPRFTAYVLPTGFKSEDAKELGFNVQYNARMKPDLRQMRIRFLNWANTPETPRTMWMTNVSVREVPAALLSQGVRQGNVVSAINLSTEGVKIQGSKIELIGDVDIVDGTTRVTNFSFDAGRGGTLTLGGEGNVHGRMQVLDANGDTVADLDASTGGFAELAVGYLTAPNKAEYVNYNEVESDFHVATAWGGTTGVSGEPSDENDGRGFATPLATIAEVVRRLPQVFDGTVNIRLATGQTFDERVNFRGFSGNGTINIFCASSTGTSTLNGDIKCGRGGVHVTVDRIKINHTSNSSQVVEVTAGLAHIRNCEIRGNADTLVGVDANYGGFAYVTDCTINGCNVGVRAIYGGIMRSWNNRGRNRTNGIESNGGILIASGTQPAGDVANVKTYNNGFQQSASTTFPDAAVAPPPPPPKQTTVKWESTGGNTYRVTQGYWDTQWAFATTVAQGRWDGNTGLLAGAWFFGSGPSVAAGKNIKSIKVYIKREAAGGLGGAVTVTLRPHAYTSRPSGAPSFLSGSQNVSISRGEGKWVTLPSSFHTAFKSGGARGIGVQTTSTSQSNYARLLKAAALEITYE